MTSGSPYISRAFICNKSYGLFAEFEEDVLQAELARPRRPGALSGRIVGVKANISVQGAGWSAGLRHRADIVAQSDANVTHRLRQAGARILPGLNMDAAALGGMTENADFGRTSNPIAPSRSAGGSSGGSAAAVASGLVDLAIGTDTLGSIRIPAAYCGVFGLKPTFGLVGRSGIVPLAPSLDTVGLLTAKAADLWPLLVAIAGPDVGDADTRPAPADWEHDRPDTGIHRLKIGIPDQVAEVSCEPEILEALKRASAVLSDAGSRITFVSMPGWNPARLRQKAFVLTECEGAVVFAEELRQGDVLPRSVERLLSFGRDLGPGRLIAAIEEIRAARAQLDRTFAEVNLLLMPTTPQRAVPAGTGAPDNQADFTALANVCGTPALAVPVPNDPLPASVQLVGPRWSEPRLIALAACLENVLQG